MATNTKSDLASALVHDLGLPKILAKKLVDAFFEELREAIIRGDTVEIRGFGAWKVKDTNSRPNARNPKTGETINIPARRKVSFKPGKILKEALFQPIEDQIIKGEPLGLASFAERAKITRLERTLQVRKVVSGGQTGADRAALDVAIELGMPCGGWCPKGRKAEDGPIPNKYPLQETPSGDYVQRTEWNVRNSSGTLVVTRGKPTGGTAFTIEAAKRYKKGLLAVDFEEYKSLEDMANEVRSWLIEQNIQILNVAGPRKSKDPQIYIIVRSVLLSVLKHSFSEKSSD